MEQPTQAGAAPVQPTPPETAAPAPETTEPTGGFCIEIRVDAQGKMSVGVELLEEEQAADDAAGLETDYQPVASLNEAFRLVKEIVASGGEMADTSASQDEMASGYGKAGV